MYSINAAATYGAGIRYPYNANPGQSLYAGAVAGQPQQYAMPLDAASFQAGQVGNIGVQAPVDPAAYAMARLTQPQGLGDLMNNMGSAMAGLGNTVQWALGLKAQHDARQAAVAAQGGQQGAPGGQAMVNPYVALESLIQNSMGLSSKDSQKAMELLQEVQKSPTQENIDKLRNFLKDTSGNMSPESKSALEANIAQLAGLIQLAQGGAPA